MKRDKIFTGLIAWALALVTVLAGIGCVVTGFDLAVTEWRLIILFCALFAMVAAVCCSFRWGALALPFAAAILLLLNCHTVAASVQVLLNRISNLFDRAYGWGVIPIYDPESSYVPTAEPALIAMAFPVIAGVCWTVCRGKWVGFGLLSGLAPMMLCCVVTDTVPAVWCITLLLGALLTLTLTQLVRRRSLRDGNRLTAIVLIPVILVSFLLPLYAVQTDYQEQAQRLQDQFLYLISHWKGISLGSDPGPGDGETVPTEIIIPDSTPVDLSELGPQHLGNNTRFDVDGKYWGPLYLRGSAYDTYTGTSWTAETDTVGENGWPYAGLESRDQIVITTHGNPANICYFPYYTLDDSWTDGLIKGSISNYWGLRRYRFGFYICSGTAEYTPLSSDENTVYLALPPDTQAAAAEILSNIFEDGADYSDNEKAELIAQYVSSSAVYDLNTEKMPENADDFALWFLEEGETGYCVHYATAATVLLRAAGVPARYVSGYLTHANGSHTTVTADQAHAWVEYLNPDCGWAVLEATPGALERIEPVEPTEPSVTDPTEDPTEPNEDTTAPTEESTEPPEESTAPSRETQPSATTGGPSHGGAAEMNLTWLWYVLGILLIWALLAVQHWLRRRVRRKKLMKGDNNRQALRRWLYVRRAVRILKLSMPEHLQTLAEKAVFSQHILTDEELEQFDLWLQKAKRQILTKPWPIRLTLWFVYAI